MPQQPLEHDALTPSASTNAEPSPQENETPRTRVDVDFSSVAFKSMGNVRDAVREQIFAHIQRQFPGCELKMTIVPKP
jgi:hypothetical protein